MNITHEEFEAAVKVVISYQSQLNNQKKFVDKQLDSLSPFIKVSKNDVLVDSNMSVRLYNLLKQNHAELGLANNFFDVKVSELANISKNSFVQIRNSGKNALKEIEELCYYVGIELKP